MRGLAILLLFGSFIGLLFAQQENATIDSCLRCICNAVSNCNQKVGCESGVCGPFRITEQYWLDAAKPIIGTDDPNSNESYVDCTTNLKCAKTTVRNYVTKYSKDCNGDGVIDCYDYAKIHLLGPNSCTETVHKVYKDVLLDCLSAS
ncbi:lysozyme-like [Lycorma delicatula]|uniref:lysozyme-like n=1 Tax=Lycorma delicatula TaxID=130591 RepID=UPI003F51724B